MIKSGNVTIEVLASQILPKLKQAKMPFCENLGFKDVRGFADQIRKGVAANERTASSEVKFANKADYLDPELTSAILGKIKELLLIGLCSHDFREPHLNMSASLLKPEKPSVEGFENSRLGLYMKLFNSKMMDADDKAPTPSNKELNVVTRKYFNKDFDPNKGLVPSIVLALFDMALTETVQKHLERQGIIRGEVARAAG